MWPFRKAIKPVDEFHRVVLKQKFPDWVGYDTSDPGKFQVDPNIIYTRLLKALGVQADKYWLSVCRRTVIDYINENTKGRRIPLRLKIRGDGDRRQKWNPQNFPNGKGEELGATEYTIYHDKLLPVLQRK